MDARICRWLGGKQAALSFRFDDSHPTHVENAVPILNDYGFVGTFMVNPGRENHEKFKDAWEGSIIRQGHELANHTFNHRGAKTDQEAEAEVGKTSEYIWRVQPDRGRLLPPTDGQCESLAADPLVSETEAFHLGGLKQVAPVQQVPALHLATDAFVVQVPVLRPAGQDEKRGRVANRQVRIGLDHTLRQQLAGLGNRHGVVCADGCPFV